MKCPNCGSRMYRICNTCGVWISDCKNKRNHKDKAWLCPRCDKKMED